jgi:hypothetical protein
MSQTTITSTPLDRSVTSSVSAPRPEGNSQACPAATGPYRGLLLGMFMSVPLWVILGIAIYEVL